MLLCGKPLNLAMRDQIMKNEEVQTIRKIMGLQHIKDYSSDVMNLGASPNLTLHMIFFPPPLNISNLVRDECLEVHNNGLQKKKSFVDFSESFRVEFQVICDVFKVFVEVCPQCGTFAKVFPSVSAFPVTEFMFKSFP